MDDQYKVRLHRAQYTDVFVEAEDEATAGRIAMDMLYEGSIDEHLWESVADSEIIDDPELVAYKAMGSFLLPPEFRVFMATNAKYNATQLQSVTLQPACSEDDTPPIELDCTNLDTGWKENLWLAVKYQMEMDCERCLQLDSDATMDAIKDGVDDTPLARDDYQSTFDIYSQDGEFVDYVLENKGDDFWERVGVIWGSIEAVKTEEYQEELDNITGRPSCG